MCLAVPMKIKSIDGMEAVAVSGGLVVPVQLDLVEGAQVDDYVIVHAGYAITIVDAAEAEETLEILTRLAEIGGGIA